MLGERAMDRNNGTAAFPSFHVVWAFLGAAVYAARWPRLRFGCWCWATLVAASCVLTGMHSLIDIVAGFGVFLLVYNYRFFTHRLRTHLERGSDQRPGSWTSSSGSFRAAPIEAVRLIAYCGMQARERIESLRRDPADG